MNMEMDDIMNISDIVSIGEKVDFDIDNEVYRTIVEDIPTENTFLVSELSRENRRARIEPNDEVDVYCYRSDAMYVFSAVLLDTIDEGNIELLQFEVVGELSRHQRRDSYRLQTSKKVDVWKFSEAVGGELDMQKFSAATMDLSETGMLLLTHEKVERGQVVNCEIQLDRRQSLSVKAEALRVECPMYRDQPYQIGFKFIGASEQFRRTILKFILQEQIIAKRGI